MCGCLRSPLLRRSFTPYEDGWWNVGDLNSTRAFLPGPTVITFRFTAASTLIWHHIPYLRGSVPFLILYIYNTKIF